MAIVVVAVVIGVVFVARQDKEPQFNGKSLSYWMEQELSTYPRQNEEAVRALRGMGEPAVKWLTAIVEREDSALTRQLLSYSEKIPALQNFVTSKYWYRIFAVKMLADIGPSAASAIPALEKMSRDSDKMLSRPADAALICVRDEPLESYINAYRHREDTNWTRTYAVLLELGSKAKPAIPVLLEELQSTNFRVRLLAMTLLGTAAPNSPECFPVFTNLLSNTNKTMRYKAADGLVNQGSIAKPAAPMVANLLDDPEDACRSSALMFLWRVVPSEEFAPFLARVQEATNDSSEIVRLLAERVLKEKKISR